MSEVNAVTSRNPVTLTISVLQIRNLRGEKEGNVEALVKVEYGEKVLGESPKIECSANCFTDLNYDATMTIAPDDHIALDEIACRPILCTVIETLPKEKKQKEDKVNIIGQCTLDLLPFLIGETKCRVVAPLYPVPGSPLENLPPDQNKPELEIQLAVSEPLLTQQQLCEGNIINVAVESLFSPPEAWNSVGQNFSYVAAMPIPQAPDRENLAVFAGGKFIKPLIDREIHDNHKRWPVPSGALGNAIYIGNELLGTERIEQECGELRSCKDFNHRSDSYHDKPRVWWNIERRCCLDDYSSKTLREKIGCYRYWPVEIFRTSTPGGKTKGKNDDEISFHGIAYVDLSPLLYPGATRIRGAYRVHAFYEHELTEKTKRTAGSVSEDAFRIATNILTRNSSPMSKGAVPKKEDAKAAAKTEKKSSPKQPKKGSSSDKSSSKTVEAPKDGSATEPEPIPVNVEGAQFDEACSYIMIEINLYKPLIEKRVTEELAMSVAAYIPPRPMFPKKTDSAQRSVDDFHNQISIVANLLLDEFREKYGDQLASFCDGREMKEVFEEKRQELIYNLNASGKYLAFKEQLKHAVVKIVREKYLRTSNFQDKNEFQAFIGELYVYLIDEMHVALDQVLSVVDQEPVPCPITESAQLKHFAREAEVNENFALAARFYQERIARDRCNPDHWFDYGTFSMYLNDIAKAEECFKECISRNQCHIHGLILNGIISNLQGRHEAAEVFFETATSYEPDSILAWTMFGLFYDGIGNQFLTEMALGKANQLNFAAALALTIPPPKEVCACVPPEEKKEESTPENKDAVPQTPDQKGKKAKPPASPKSPKGKKGGKVKEPVEPLPDLPPCVSPCETIYMQIMEFLLDVKAIAFAERALAHHLLDPIGGPSAKYYIALARLKLLKNEIDQVECNLNAALQWDFQNPDAWAIMGHLKYLTGDTENAKNCYERTLSFVADASEMHSIYLRLASIYLSEAKFQDAKNTFLLACRRSPSCVSWQGVGIACYRMCELDEAEQALTEANILNNEDAEVWAYLCLICLQTGRQLESEQAYKYAMKLNLQDKYLIREINELQCACGYGNPEF